ncbi:hypothetical protein SteCoe_3016 [Stentor coeruleus]|uniref:Receptor ligand binding region domain-containing protein n=1 Tax=Stentor coeruleus TaxID=5963 RepID=A0A1R2CY78_9CILI|nr:hypothetical protein SteCoe_3016 [Stentor coeruleus]
MLLFILTFYITHAVLQISIGALVTDYTSTSLLLEVFSSLQGAIDSAELQANAEVQTNLIIEYLPVLPNADYWFIPESFAYNQIKILIDLTGHIEFSQFIASQAVLYNFLHIVDNRPLATMLGEIPGSNTLYTYPCSKNEAEALYTLVKHFGWKNIGLIYDDSISNYHMANYFKNFFGSTDWIKEEIQFDEDYIKHPEILKDRLLSTTANSQAKIMVVMTNPVLASSLLKAADQAGLGFSGYAWILNSDAMENLSQTLYNSNTATPIEHLGVSITGVIGLQADFSALSTKDTFEGLTSVLALAFTGISQLEYPYGTSIINYIKTHPNERGLPEIYFTSIRTRKLTYHIYNIVKYSMVQVGYYNLITKAIELFNNATIIWPGSETFPPDSKTLPLKLVFLVPSSSDPQSKYIKNGLELAVSQINADSTFSTYFQLLPIYQEPFPPIHSIIEYNIKVLESYNVIGYIGPSSADIGLLYAKSLSSDIEIKPLVSYGISESSLSNTLSYPCFLRTIMHDGYQASAVIMFLVYIDRSKIALLYTEDSAGKIMYDTFISISKTMSTDIANDEDKRRIRVLLNEDGSISSTTKDDIHVALKDVVRKKLKIIVFLGNKIVSAELAKQIYERELHGDDYALIGSIWLDDTVWEYIDNFYSGWKDEIFNVLDGAITLAQSGVKGTIGQKFAEDFLDEYDMNYTTEALLAYDTVYLYAKTLKSMIENSQNVHNGQELLNALRRTDFLGASGKVVFQADTNDRSSYGYKVVNLRKNGQFVTIFTFNPQDVILFSQEPGSQLLWHNGILSTPHDSWNTTFDCPFAEHMQKISTKGVIIIISIGFFLFVLTLFLSLFSYKKWRQIKIIKITKPVIRSVKDTLVEVQIAVEFFQFMAIAPTFKSLEIVVQSASNIFMLDILKVAQSQKQSYWILLIVVCTICFFWFVFVAIISTNIEHYVKKIPYCQRIIGILNNTYLPFFGNTMFLPFTALMLDAFICDHSAQGHDFVWRDCYMQCWGNDHIPYIILSSFAIIVYEPVAVFIRPLWQQASTGLNLKIRPFFLLFKTCMQILLIAFGKSLQGISPLAHGVVFTVLFITFVAVTIKVKPFNYNRCNLWEISSLIAITYMSILATISYNASPESIAWFIALIVGWLIIIAITMFIQRKYMPDLLVSPNRKKTRRSLKDVFSKGKVENYNEEATPGIVTAKEPTVVYEKNEESPSCLRDDKSFSVDVREVDENYNAN